MPWLIYPKVNGKFYGYLMDGLLTGAVFFIILCILIYQIYRRKSSKLLNGVILFFSFAMTLIAWNKYYKCELEKTTYSTDNPIYSAMSAGFTQGIGLYVLGWSSLALFLVTLLHLYEIKNKTDIFSQLKNSSIFSKKIIWSTTVLVLCILTFFLINQFYNKKSWNTQNLTPVLNQNMVKMGSALRNEQYLEFLKYNHPLMIQSIGGQNKMIELLQNTMRELKKVGTNIESIELDEISEIQQSGKNDIQALTYQNIKYTGSNQKDRQKVLAVTENGGDNWYFITIQNKTLAEVKKIFPSLNPQFKF